MFRKVNLEVDFTIHGSGGQARLGIEGPASLGVLCKVTQDVDGRKVCGGRGEGGRGGVVICVDGEADLG